LIALLERVTGKERSTESPRKTAEERVRAEPLDVGEKEEETGEEGFEIR
jgi:hypothetical protein